MTQSSARIAVVGVGYLGRFHAQKYAKLAAEGRCELTGVYDPEVARARTVATELQTTAFGTLAEVTDRSTAVVVASATPFHAVNATELLESGKIKYLLVEKPVTHDMVSARTLYAKAEESSAKIFVGHSERFQPILAEISERLPEAEFIQIERAHPPASRTVTTSVILDLMIHDLDLLLWMLPGWSVRILSAQKQAWAAAASLRFEKNGNTKTVFLRSSRVVENGPTLRKWVLVGARENHADFLQTKADTLLLESTAFARIAAGDRAPSKILATMNEGMAALKLATAIEDFR